MGIQKQKSLTRTVNFVQHLSIMASGNDLLEGKSFAFDPEEEESQDFLNSLENRSESVSKEIIKDVVSEIQPAFEEDGIPSDVLELLQKIWIGKLEKLREQDDPSSSPNSPFHGFPGVMMQPKPVSSQTSEGAVPKKSKIQQVDGPNDS